jgi:hypothetical protein
MAGHLLVDSNIIETPELAEFLAEGLGNLAILSIEVWFELYKQRSISALRRGLEIMGSYPDQIIWLRPTGEIVRLDPVAPGLIDRMIDHGWARHPGDAIRTCRRGGCPRHGSTA